MLAQQLFRSFRSTTSFSLSKQNLSKFYQSIVQRRYCYSHEDTQNREFWVLGIETSCDDTCAAVVNSNGNVISHCVSSQFEVHQSYGGIVPSLAARAHESNISHVIDKVISESSLSDESIRMNNLGAIAVTAGPGLQPCLGVGIKSAKELSDKWNIPLIAINHLEAHALISRLPSDGEYQEVTFPFLLLLVSGGHTQLIKADDVGNYSIIGTTLDDAVGEAFDKTARLLNIQSQPNIHPGEQLENMAENGDNNVINLTLPLKKQKGGLNFSYSGLKSQVRRLSERMDMTDDINRNNLACSFQYIATKHLVDRLKNALTNDSSLSTLVIAGGVARNQYIRKQINNLESIMERPLNIIFPKQEYCTDNGVMVAWAAIERIKKQMAPVFKGEGDKEVIFPTPRWSISNRSFPKL